MRHLTILLGGLIACGGPPPAAPPPAPPTPPSTPGHERVSFACADGPAVVSHARGGAAYDRACATPCEMELPFGAQAFFIEHQSRRDHFSLQVEPGRGLAYRHTMSFEDRPIGLGKPMLGATLISVGAVSSFLAPFMFEALFDGARLSDHVPAYLAVSSSLLGAGIGLLVWGKSEASGEARGEVWSEPR